jgi:serine/threonine protein kinase
VYKAQVRGTQEVVAVKVIPVGDKDEVLEIQKEIEMLKECNHPNVVRYLVSHWRSTFIHLCFPQPSPQNFSITADTGIQMI